MKILVNATQKYPDLDHIKVQQILIEIELEHANIKYVLEDESNEQIGTQKGLSLLGAEYAAWGNDDTYVKNWILTQLGLTERQGDAYGG